MAVESSVGCGRMGVGWVGLGRFFRHPTLSGVATHVHASVQYRNNTSTERARCVEEVRLYRTFSIYIIAGEARCAG